MNANKYNLVFISTFIDHQYIEKLINSVISHNNKLSIFFIIVNQTHLKLVFPNSPQIDFIELNTDRQSLSKARNIGINYLLENNIDFEHIMFPDDDTTFSEPFFSKYKEFIKPEKNYLIDVYCEGSEKLFKQNKYNDNTYLYRANYDAAMSVNMIVCHKTFLIVGLFDERLGVGAKYGAGEDVDYFIRACNSLNNKFQYKKELFNYHPSNNYKFREMKLNKITNKLVNYGNGVVFLMCKHKMYFEALKICFRAIGGACISLCKFEFKMHFAYTIVFFTRMNMFLKCFIFSKKLFKQV